jgi:hypothetical protein
MEVSRFAREVADTWPYQAHVIGIATDCVGVVCSADFIVEDFAPMFQLVEHHGAEVISITELPIGSLILLDGAPLRHDQDLRQQWQVKDHRRLHREASEHPGRDALDRFLSGDDSAVVQ